MSEFTSTHFEKYRKLIYERYGIFFSDAKKTLLIGKIDKLLRDNKITSYDEYFNIINNPSNQSYITEFINTITVNKTEFFRENSHFDFLKNSLSLISKKNPRIIKNREIRVWCSACSTGQEAYTIAMVLNDLFKDQYMDIKILATDISTKVIKIAQQGRYSGTISNEIPPHYFSRYFDIFDSEVEAKQSLKDKITFRKFNLMEPFPFANKFDIIFCRNVMIYFDIPTQEKLLQKFYNYMPDGGLLFIGQSESLINKKNQFSYLQPSVYYK